MYPTKYTLVQQPPVLYWMVQLSFITASPISLPPLSLSPDNSEQACICSGPRDYQYKNPNVVPGTEALIKGGHF